MLYGRIFFLIPETKRPILKQAKKKLVVAEAGKHMGTKGVAVMQLLLEEVEIEWEVYIAPIGDDMLLGCDLLDERI